LRWIFGNSKGSLDAAGLGLADVASDAWNLWIVKCLNADLMVCSYEFPRGFDAAYLAGNSRWHAKDDRKAKQDNLENLLHRTVFSWVHVYIKSREV
jgi:hypothetical protein